MLLYEYGGWQIIENALKALGLSLISLNTYEGLEFYKDKNVFSGFLGDDTEVGVEWNVDIVTITFYGVTEECLRQIQSGFRKEIKFQEEKTEAFVALEFNRQALLECAVSIPIYPRSRNSHF